jgi:transcriptional regulator with XRE-family HTH domain
MMELTPNAKLKSMLFKKGITQRDLGFGSNIDETRISKIIRGYEKPTYEMKEAIADFLKAEIEELF